jgi:hypothetical protein
VFFFATLLAVLFFETALAKTSLKNARQERFDYASRVHVVVLDKLGGDAFGRQDVFAIGLGKKAAGMPAFCG